MAGTLNMQDRPITSITKQLAAFLDIPACSLVVRTGIV